MVLVEGAMRLSASRRFHGARNPLQTLRHSVPFRFLSISRKQSGRYCASADKIGAKIRNATMEKVPYMLVVGEKEVAENKVAVRHRTEGDKGAVSIEEFIGKAQQEIATKGAA